MKVLMVGTSHRTAPLALRERLALGEDAAAAFVAELREGGFDEVAVLSTCNRLEIYAAQSPPLRSCGGLAQHDGVNLIHAPLARHTGVPVADVAAACIHREGAAAVRHLFRVAGGLSSMVLGEPQILGQVRRAYDAARHAHTVGPVLHHLFQAAINHGKRLRRDEAFLQRRASVGSVAIDLARSIFDDLSTKKVLAIGAGELNKVMLRQLMHHRPQRVWLVNRSLNNARALADELNLTAHPAPTPAPRGEAPHAYAGPSRGGARAWDDLDTLLAEADLVLTGTGSPQPILTPDRLQAAIKRRRGRPLTIIDSAVPRDVDPACGSLRNVYLYNLDDLQNVLQQQDRAERTTVDRLDTQVQAAADRAYQELQDRDVGRLIRELRDRLHAIGEAEARRTRRKLEAIPGHTNVDASTRLVEEHTRRVINKILHLPLSSLDEAEGASAAFHAAALRRLFALDEEDKPPPV